MENFTNIAEDCINGKLKGTFVLRNGNKVNSSTISNCSVDGYTYILGGRGYNERGDNSVWGIDESEFDVVQFISTKMYKVYTLRALFMLLWPIEKLFMILYFVPAVIMSAIIWVFVLAYRWITGRYDAWGKDFTDIASDTFCDVAANIICWPNELMDDFEHFVKHL